MRKRGIALLLSLAMIFSMFPINTFAFATEFSDLPNDWSAKALENAAANGLLKGDNGKIMPKDNLTRAQMATIVNRAFGTTEKSSIDEFTDVQKDAWYYDEMSKAVQMKTFIGSGGKLYPDSNITREEAFIVLARAFKISGANVYDLESFSDRNDISNWAREGVSSLVAAGYIAGSNGRINPKQNITRAEFAQMMDNLLKNYISEEGTYTEDYRGNLMINVPNVTLKGLTVTGDLIIGDGVGDGEVTLDDVTVAGRVLVRGGGENSIKITGNSSIKNIIIARVDGVVRFYAEEGAEIGEVIADGNNDVIIEGNFGTVTIVGTDITITATSAIIESVSIEGENSKIIIDENSSVKLIDVKANNAKISGEGTVERVTANANDVEVTVPGTSVTAGEGTRGVTAGELPVAPGGSEIVPSKLVETVGGGRGTGGNRGGTPSEDISVSEISVDKTTMTLTAGGATGTITATVLPVNAANKNVTWSSNNNSVATVDGGVVTPVGAGTATITATSAADGAKKAECTVTVTAVIRTITFIIRDSGTQDIISGANVSIAEQSKTTDQNGRAVFELGNGALEYTVTAEGYETVTDTTEATGSGTVTRYLSKAAAAVNKDALTAAINAEYSDGASRTTYNLTEAGYTVATWTAYTGAITTAIGVEADGNATQAAVDAAAAAIVAAKGSLVKIYTLTYQPTMQGSIAGTGVQKVEHGGNGTPVTAKPNAGYKFVKWNDGVTDNPRTDINVTADMFVTPEFEKINDTTVSISIIAGVTIPVKGETPVSTIAATDEYTAIITWDPVDATFGASTVYTATITITPKTGYTLTGVASNFFIVPGVTAVTNAADSGTVTAVFPATASKLASTIAFTEAGPIAKLTTDVPFTNEATGAGTGAITYTSGTPGTATVDANTGLVTIAAAGSTVITATQAESDTHLTGAATYTLNVRVPNNNADLIALNYNYGAGQVSVPNFDTGTLTYNVELPVGTINQPAITFMKSDGNAGIVVNPGTGFPSATTVVVTAEDKTTIRTYTINFTVANADQAAPTRLAGVAPTTAGGNDGKITGTTTAMEYKLASAEDSTYAACGDTETTGLAAEEYVVRLKAKAGFNAGATAAVTVPAPLPAMTGTAAITGDAKFGQTLTVDITGLTNAGTPTYQWNRDGVTIDGATASVYTLVEADITKVITVTATADGVAGTGSITSAGTAAVAKADGPTAPVAPTVSSQTDTSVTLTGNALHQFNVNGGTWQDSEIFTGLTRNTEYTFTARIKETATHKASAAGDAIVVTTNPTTVTIQAIPGVIVPVKGAAPVTMITETDQYTGTVTWSGSPVTFAASTVYTADINLIPKTGYTFSGVAANFFAVEGATSVLSPESSGIVTAAFPATAAQQYTLTLTGAKIISSPAAGLIDENTSVTVTVAPETGQTVANFLVDGVDKKSELSGNTYTFTMAKNTTINSIIKLAQVAQPTWTGNVINWVDVADELEYAVMIYKDGILLSGHPADSNTTSYDFKWLIEGDVTGGNYTVQIRASANEALGFWHGDNSVASEAKVVLSSEKAITSFSFAGLDPVVNGVVNEEAKTIALTVPNATDVTALVATFTNSAPSSVKVGETAQTSGTTENDFTAPVSYVVTAENGTTATYTVTVTVEAAPTYAVTLGTITRVEGDEESTIEISGAPAGAGATVYLSVAPKTGMRLKAGTLKATYNDSTLKELLLSGTAPYSFIMPAYPVVVTAEFEISDSSLISVAGLTDTAPTGGSGTAQMDPINWAINVPNTTATLLNSDITVSTGAAVAMYSSNSFSTAITEQALIEGYNWVYIKVVSQSGLDTTYYTVRIYKAAV